MLPPIGAWPNLTGLLGVKEAARLDCCVQLGSGVAALAGPEPGTGALVVVRAASVDIRLPVALEQPVASSEPQRRLAHGR